MTTSTDRSTAAPLWWIFTRNPLNGTPTVSSLTVCFINTSTPEITLSLEIVFLLWFCSPLLLSTCNFHTTSLPLWCDNLSSWKKDSGN
ncbi:hypothetical protein OUZ56_025143 [Daphnia magna]|uniref:Uncharacterized protein n=1 Tax=Daphnia magna TaxID=35525 RepID=A0ABQ9ZJL7_9CRUS|nr:hypothetical protein OUZ56_025143 [Daphnia magna]